MGDHGRAYQHITPEFCNHMKDFVSRGDIITPNLTEACLLTDMPYPKHDCTDSELSSISKKLHALGVKNVLLPAVQKATLSLTIFPIAVEMWILFPRKSRSGVSRNRRHLRQYCICTYLTGLLLTRMYHTGSSFYCFLYFLFAVAFG